MNIHVGMLLATIHLGMLTPSASLSVDAARVVRQLHPTPTHRTAQPAMLTVDRRAVTTLAPAAAAYTLLVGSPHAGGALDATREQAGAADLFRVAV